MLIYNDTHWRSFFAAVGTPAMADDPHIKSVGARLANIDAVYGEAGRTFRTRTTAEWEALLAEADIPNMPMHTLASLRDDLHLAAVGFFEETDHPSEGPVTAMRMPSRWSRSQPRAGGPAPRLGEHTRAVLGEAGLSGMELDALEADGIIADASRARQA